MNRIEGSSRDCSTSSVFSRCSLSSTGLRSLFTSVLFQRLCKVGCEIRTGTARRDWREGSALVERNGAGAVEDSNRQAARKQCLCPNRSVRDVHRYQNIVSRTCSTINLHFLCRPRIKREINYFFLASLGFLGNCTAACLLLRLDWKIWFVRSEAGYHVILPVLGVLTSGLDIAWIVFLWYEQSLNVEISGSFIIVETST